MFKFAGVLSSGNNKQIKKAQRERGFLYNRYLTTHSGDIAQQIHNNMYFITLLIAPCLREL